MPFYPSLTVAPRFSFWSESIGGDSLSHLVTYNAPHIHNNALTRFRINNCRQYQAFSHLRLHTTDARITVTSGLSSSHAPIVKPRSHSGGAPLARRPTRRQSPHYECGHQSINCKLTHSKIASLLSSIDDANHRYRNDYLAETSEALGGFK